MLEEPGKEQKKIMRAFGWKIASGVLQEIQAHLSEILFVLRKRCDDFYKLLSKINTLTWSGSGRRGGNDAHIL